MSYDAICFAYLLPWLEIQPKTKTLHSERASNCLILFRLANVIILLLILKRMPLTDTSNTLSLLFAITAKQHYSFLFDNSLYRWPCLQHCASPLVIFPFLLPFVDSLLKASWEHGVKNTQRSLSQGHSLVTFFTALFDDWGSQRRSMSNGRSKVSSVVVVIAACCWRRRQW